MSKNPAQFLRTVLTVDALTCLATGLASLSLGPMLAGVLGLSTGLLQGSGAALLAVAAFIAFAAKTTPPAPWAVWVVVLGNAAWVLGSVLLLVAGFESPTALGTAYVIAQAVVVAVLAELEYTGLKKLTGASAIPVHN
jgi:hypothetical protein